MSTIFINSFWQATPWYLSGGAPMPIAVYNVREGGSLAGSYVNVVNPGTFDAAPGVAPAWSGTTGWGLNGIDQYLTTGIAPGSGWSALVRFSNTVPGSDTIILGCRTSANNGLYLDSRTAIGDRYYAYGTRNLISGGAVSSGVMAVAGTGCYLDGVADGTVSGVSTTIYGLFIGCLNNAGSPVVFAPMDIQYIAIWDDDTDHATWMPAVSDAVSLL